MLKKLNNLIFFIILGFIVIASLGAYKTGTKDTGWDAITGVPTNNSYVSATPGASKILYSDINSKIKWTWLEGITGTVTTSIGTTTTTTDLSSELLFHMNGTNTSPTFVNDGYGTMSITTVSPAQISTAASKFGGASGIFDGVNAEVDIADSGIFDIPANTRWDFSVELNPDVIAGNDGFFAYNGTPAIEMDLKLSNLEVAIGTQTITTAAPPTGTWTQVYVSFDGRIGRIFKGGIQTGTATMADTVSWSLGASGIYIGDYAGGGFGYDGYMDELRFRVNPPNDANFHTSNFGSTTAVYSGNSTYNEDTIILKDTLNNIQLIKIIIPGTATAEKTYIFFPGSVTVFGGTSTTEIGTTTPGLIYGVPNKGAATFDAFNVHSANEIKADVKSFTGKEKLLKMNTKSWHPKVRDIYILDAEAVAKDEYIRKDYIVWELANKNNYITSVEMPGTGTVQIFDSDKMLQDYKTEKELLWASDLNQQKLIQTTQDKLESDETITRLGFMVHDSLTPKEVIEGEAINLMSVVALAVKAIQLQQEEIDSLTTALKNLRILNNLK